MLIVFILSVFMLNDIRLSVIILNDVMLNVVIINGTFLLLCLKYGCNGYYGEL
jgi:hypothetical protein